MNPRRKERLESLLRREIATCLSHEVRDPRLGFVTVTRCEFNQEEEAVTAFYTVFGDEGARRTTTKCLHEVRGFVQRSYAKVLKMRFVPSLHFAYDEGEVRRREMDDLIRRARASDPDRGVPSAAEADG